MLSSISAVFGKDFLYRTQKGDTHSIIMEPRDTVSSVGAIPRAELPFSNSANPSIRYFRQALALDERRAKFGSNDFIARLNDESTREIHTNDTDHEKHVETTECEHEFEFAETQPKRAWKTDVHEAWFVGAHCGMSLWQ